MKIIKRDNALISYNISGNGEFTLLFVHGSYNDRTYWKSQVDHFSSEYTVVTLDLPGHGESGTERKHWSVQGFALDVIAVIEQLNLKNVILIGHSMGAEVNLIVSTYAPSLIIGFMAVDNFKNAATPLPQEYEEHVKQILYRLKVNFADTNEQYARMALVTAETPDEIRQRVVNDYRNAFEPMGLELMPAFFKMYELERELLPVTKFKLHLINVDYVPIDEEPLKLYAGHGFHVQHMNGTCHFPMLENPEKLNVLIGNALEKITRSVIAWPQQYFFN